MRSNKKKIVVAVLSIAIIMSILIVGAILFLTTDFLKSDQELFFKYFLQNIDIAEEYLKDPNQNVTEQMKSASYIVDSDISFDLVSSESEIANQTTPPRNFSIKYTKNADPLNDRDYSEAKIKYLTKELFTAKYAHDGDLHVVNGTNAITSNDLFNIYLGIENKDLKQLAQKLGEEDVSNIPNKIGKFSLTELLSLTEPEKQYVQNLLIQVINSQVSKNSYFHNKGVGIQIDKEKVNTNAYGVKLTNKEYKNLVVTILEAISEDKTILNILLQKVMLIDPQTDLTIDTISSKVQEMIKQVNNKNFTEGIIIQVYENNGQLVRTQIQENDQEYYIIDNQRKNDSIRTLISLNYIFPKTEENENEQTNNVTFTDDGYQVIEGSASGEVQEVIPETTIYTIKSIEFKKEVSGNENNITGILTFDMDDETYTISLQNMTKQNNSGLTNNIILIINNSNITYFTVKANSNISLSKNITVQDLNETNSAVLNNRTPENISQLLTAIKAQLKKIYEQQMEVARQMQENSQTSLNPTNPNAEEANTITNRTDVVGQ